MNEAIIQLFTGGISMNIPNEDIKEIIAEIPEGHRHLRTTIVFEDGQSMTFQEATIANLVRAYIEVKTDPVRTRVRLRGSNIKHRKKGFAEWQLVED
jgi:allophanate hydrolase subunit 2